MSFPNTGVVYDEHWQTIEVARNALAKGREIFVNRSLVEHLLWGKYDNPIAGVTGLHLYLDAKERWDAGDRTFDIAALTQPERGPVSYARTVLKNLGELLSESAAGQEPADLTALRVRAGLQEEQAVVDAPPMFRASWAVLKANAARDGKTWIGCDLWRETRIWISDE